MAAGYVKVDNGAKVVLAAPVECVLQQIPSLGQLCAFLVPELLLVDRDTYKVKAQLLQTCKVVLLDVQSSCLTSLLALREPVADVGTTLDAEIVNAVLGLFLVLCLVSARCCSC